MPVYFNPAGALTANRIPYALGGGRLGDSALTYSNPSGAIYRIASSNFFRLEGPDGVDVVAGGFTRLMIHSSSGNVCIGDPTDRSNGKVQLLSHSAFSGGLAFGTDATGAETLYRFASGHVKLGGTGRLSADTLQATSSLMMSDLGGGGHFFTASLTSSLLEFVHSSSPVRIKAPAAIGWGLPTGTLTRTTFDPATVTLSQLAERVAALVTDFHTSGSRHGFLAN